MFLVVGLSHKTASLELREKFAIPPEEIGQILSALLKNQELTEAFLLSTCNRVELYLVSSDPHCAEQLAFKFFHERSSLPNPEKVLYRKRDEEAIRHFFRVTSSLDSMVVGEPQITGQVKEAYSQATSVHATGPFVNKLTHSALRTAKRVRNETEISLHPVSVSYAAVNLAEKIFGSLREKKILLVGAGEMAELAAEHFLARKVCHLTISNRTEEKAKALAERFHAATLPFESLCQNLSLFDIIMTSTSVSSPFLDSKIVALAMAERQNSPLFLIDIAVPRNIDPGVNKIPNVYLYDMDDLKGVVEEGLAERAKEAKKGEEIIENEVAAFEKYLQTRDVAPTIKELSKKIEAIREAEIQKTLASFSNLGPEAKEALESCTRAIVSKILHEPITGLKEEEQEISFSAEVVKKLFKLGNN
ncbi:MAG: glutamyl-tRNA reductase [Deltaproteobacteria bacterium]|nr:glutamyl-tRNA reductase [Deltaproteobacteria bacterium]